MSFDVHVMTVTNDDSDEFDRSIVERAFKSLAVDQTGNYWNLHGPDGELYSGAVCIKDQPRIAHFTVSRPPFVPEFWDGMFDVLRQTRTILCWPGEGPPPRCCVANPDWISELPRDLIEGLGEPAFVLSGAEIAAVLEGEGYPSRDQS